MIDKNKLQAIGLIDLELYKEVDEYITSLEEDCKKLSNEILNNRLDSTIDDGCLCTYCLALFNIKENHGDDCIIHIANKYIEE